MRFRSGLLIALKNCRKSKSKLYGFRRRNLASTCINLLAIMKKTFLFKKVQERHFSAHHMLLHVAKLELDLAEKSESGRFNHCLVAITFSALAVEALGNAIGDRIVKDWKDFESLSPYAKLRLIAERLGLSYFPDKDPWPRIKQLGKFRNLIAHAKPELVIEEKIFSEAEYETQSIYAPPSKLEKEITVNNAKRSLEAVNAIKVMLCDKVPVDNSMGLYFDGWSGHTQAQNEV